MRLLALSFMFAIGGLSVTAFFNSHVWAAQFSGF